MKEDGVTIAHEDDCLVIHIPMAFKKRGGRKEIVLPEGATPSQDEPTSLAKAVARAFRWQGMLETGEVAGITDLADRLGLDRCYVRRILQLASLAPDIVEAILDGQEPSGLSLDQLTKNLPESWQEQRERFGFPPRD